MIDRYSLHLGFEQGRYLFRQSLSSDSPLKGSRNPSVLPVFQITYDFFQFDSLHKAFDICPIGLVVGIDGQQDFLFRHTGYIEFIAVLVFGFLF